MNIKTLSYIHNLLKMEEDKWFYKKKMYGEFMQEEKEGSQEYEDMKKRYEECFELWVDARNALEAFEAVEW